MLQGVTAAVAEGGKLRCFLHDGATFRVEEVDYPIVVPAEHALVCPDGAVPERLSGSLPLDTLWRFDDARKYETALPELKKLAGAAPFRDQLQNALSMSGIRLFAGMDFAGLRRMQFKIEGDDRRGISAIRIADSAGRSEILGGDEREIISAFLRRVELFDPDVLEGYNCCRVDLPLLVKRAKKLDLDLALGRENAPLLSRPSRIVIAEKQLSCTRFTAAGRHVADLCFPVLIYDAAHRDLDSFELEKAAEYFSLPPADPAVLIGRLSEQLSPSFFYRTSLLPLGYQDCIVRGSGSALEALFAAEYLRAGHSLPYPEPVRRYAGAISAMERQGLFHRVRHCDVRSLYPSVLLLLGENPKHDELGLFLERLRELRRFRLDAKDKARTLPPGSERNRYEALQSSFKILINSFYGYLGFAQGSFNDFDLAEKVTAEGRRILTALVEKLRGSGASVVEMDTDGIYFCMPENVETSAFDAEIRSILPPGIELDFDAEYPAMYCHKAKNYALLDAQGRVSLTGAALKSRALEPFQRKYILAAISAKLFGKAELETEAYDHWKNAIETHTASLDDLAKSETLNDSPENYRRKLEAGTGRRSAAYEVALHGSRNFRTGDTVRFCVLGTKAKVAVAENCRLTEDFEPGVRDENVPYYLAELDALRKTFGQ